MVSYSVELKVLVEYVVVLGVVAEWSLVVAASISVELGVLVVEAVAV